ncbi:MAG TPA: malto-oligosyltrehalose synthase [Vicinamibacterales bacterium]|nr:malto-oligosyltrehalose synthase [Vicinamibacterales bacterium]
MTERPRHVPTSTYRLQVYGGFPLDAAAAIAPYLADIAIGAAYTSPYFAAEKGSTHGYDITNHNEINAEFGGPDAHRRFTTALKTAGLQHIVDFVPNHMGISTITNPWWKDVLENGPSARSAPFFDIDWNPVKRELRRKLLLPILGDQYGTVLERGELQLEFSAGRLVLKYFDNVLPVNPRQAPRVYRTGLTRLTGQLGPSHPDLLEFLSIITALQKMPAYTASGPEEVSERSRESEIARNRMVRLTEASEPIRRHIEEQVREFNGVPGRPESFDALHELLEEQAYRLAYWRTAAHEINYRRFFDINSLAGLRVEDPQVFAAIHQLLSRLLREELVTGVRVDHPDGLFDPAKYFEMLQDLAAEAWGIVRAPGSRPLYVVAEKILSGRERLPEAWAVSGTTGYNFLNQLNNVFVDNTNARLMRRVYERLTGHTESFDDLLYTTKRLIMDTSMASELNVLADMLNRISESNRRSRDFTLNSLRDVIVEVVACFPAYRTYVTGEGWTPEDRAVLERAIVRARRRNPAMDPTIFDFVREILLPRDVEDVAAASPGDRRSGGYPPADAAEEAQRLRFSMKFQQYTGPLQAKGLEDTAFYRYNVLLSLNEVGGDPSRFGSSVADFHEMNARRRHDWPFEMLATATHDTKLGEDVRARLNVLSEMPEEWGREAARWMRLNRERRTLVDGEPVPDRNDEYRFYQALLGVWPPSTDAPDKQLVARLQAYMAKAVKEAKLHSSWINPNEPYEQAVTGFVERVLTGPGSAEFLSAFLPVEARLARAGFVNTLAQVTLKIASPGVPDFYQGTELWDLTLVDPDNRRPVDYEARRETLVRVNAVLGSESAARLEAVREMLAGWQDAAIKMLVMTAGLRARRAHPEVFLEGEYLPLDTDLPVPARLVAFARVHADGRAAIAVAPTLSAHLVDEDHPLPVGDRWRTSRVLLPESLAALTFTDCFTGAEVRPVRTGDGACLFAGQVLSALPVALLMA